MSVNTLSLASIHELREVLFNVMTDGVLIVNDQGIILDCNPAFHTRLGYKKIDLIGQSVKSIDPPEFAVKVP